MRRAQRTWIALSWFIMRWRIQLSRMIVTCPYATIHSSSSSIAALHLHSVFIALFRLDFAWLLPSATNVDVRLICGAWLFRQLLIVGPDLGASLLCIRHAQTTVSRPSRLRHNRRRVGICFDWLRYGGGDCGKGWAEGVKSQTERHLSVWAQIMFWQQQITVEVERGGREVRERREDEKGEEKV